MAEQREGVLLAALALFLAVAACGESGSAFDEIGRVAEVERGRPVLVFAHANG